MEIIDFKNIKIKEVPIPNKMVFLSHTKNEGREAIYKIEGNVGILLFCNNYQFATRFRVDESTPTEYFKRYKYDRPIEIEIGEI